MSDDQDREEKDLTWLLTGLIGFGVGWLSKPVPTPAKRLEKEGIGYLTRVVREWRPVGYEGEREYQLGLHQYLLGRFSEGDVLVQREYGLGDRRADIVVDERFGIEMKRDISGAEDLKPIREQVEAIRRRLEGGLLVLCGASPEQELRQLRRKYRREDPQTGELVFDVVVAADPHVE